MDFNIINKRKQIIKNIANSIVLPTSDTIEKGGKLGQEGEIREWNGKKYKKTGGKWIPVTDPKEKKTDDETGKQPGGSDDNQPSVTKQDIAQLTLLKQKLQSGDIDAAHEIYNELHPAAQDKVPQDVVNKLVEHQHSTAGKDDVDFDKLGKDDERSKTIKDGEKELNKTSKEYLDKHVPKETENVDEKKAAEVEGLKEKFVRAKRKWNVANADKDEKAMQQAAKILDETHQKLVDAGVQKKSDSKFWDKGGDENVIGKGPDGNPITADDIKDYIKEGTQLGKDLQNILRDVKQNGRSADSLKQLKPLLDKYHKLEEEFVEKYRKAKWNDMDQHNKMVKQVNSAHSKISQITKKIGAGKYPHPMFWGYEYGGNLDRTHKKIDKIIGNSDSQKAAKKQPNKPSPGIQNTIDEIEDMMSDGSLDYDDVINDYTTNDKVDGKIQDEVLNGDAKRLDVTGFDDDTAIYLASDGNVYIANPDSGLVAKLKESNIEKAIKTFTAEETLIKAYPVGTIRQWKGKKYQKQGDGKWKPVKDGSSKVSSKTIEPKSSYGDAIYASKERATNPAGKLNKPENYSVVKYQGKFIRTTNNRVSQFEKQGGQIIGKFTPNQQFLAKKDSNKKPSQHGVGGGGKEPKMGDKKPSFTDILDNPKSKKLIEAIEGLDKNNTDHHELYKDLVEQLKSKFNYGYKDDEWDKKINEKKGKKSPKLFNLVRDWVGDYSDDEIKSVVDSLKDAGLENRDFKIKKTINWTPSKESAAIRGLSLSIAKHNIKEGSWHENLSKDDVVDIVEGLVRAKTINNENIFDDKVSKAFELLGIEKARTIHPIGTVKKFGGRQYIKTSSGWKYYGKGTGQKAQQHHQASKSDKKTAASMSRDELTEYAKKNGVYHTDTMKSSTLRNLVSDHMNNKQKKSNSSKYSINELKTALDRAASDKHDIPYAVEQEIKKLKEKYPDKAAKIDADAKKLYKDELASFDEHPFVIDDGGKLTIDVLDPDTEEKLYKPGETIKHNGKEYVVGKEIDDNIHELTLKKSDEVLAQHKSKVRELLVKYGNNPKDVDNMMKKHYNSAIKTYRSPKKVAEYIRTIY